MTIYFFIIPIGTNIFSNTSNPNISDDERRANAERAIMMLAKFMNLDDDELLDDDGKDSD